MAFIRIKPTTTPAGVVHKYVQLVENVRVDGVPTQRVLVNLGPLNEFPTLVYWLSQKFGVEKFLSWAADHPQARLVLLAWSRIADATKDQVCDLIRADLARAKASETPAVHADDATPADLLPQ